MLITLNLKVFLTVGVLAPPVFPLRLSYLYLTFLSQFYISMSTRTVAKSTDVEKLLTKALFVGHALSMNCMIGRWIIPLLWSGAEHFALFMLSG